MTAEVSRFVVPALRIARAPEIRDPERGPLKRLLFSHHRDEPYKRAGATARAFTIIQHPPTGFRLPVPRSAPEAKRSVKRMIKAFGAAVVISGAPMRTNVAAWRQNSGMRRASAVRRTGRALRISRSNQTSARFFPAELAGTHFL